MKNLFRLIIALPLLIVVVLVGFRIYAWTHETKSAAALAPQNGRFIKTEKGTVHVSIWGDENDIPVVMTHGMAAWGGLWEETARELANNNYRVIAIDQTPFGFSSRENSNYSRSEQAARLDALVTAMDLKDYILIGHSYGGGVAMETALRYPEAMVALVLISPVMVLPAIGEKITVASVPLPLRSSLIGEILVSATITNPLLTRFLVKRFMHQKDALTDRHVEILQQPAGLKGNTANMVSWLRQFLAGDPNAISRDRQQLSSAKMPIALIWGEEDTITPISQGEALEKILDPVSFARLPGIGHMPQLENPKVFNHVLSQSLREIQTLNTTISPELRTTASPIRSEPKN